MVNSLINSLGPIFYLSGKGDVKTQNINVKLDFY